MVDYLLSTPTVADTSPQIRQITCDVKRKSQNMGLLRLHVARFHFRLASILPFLRQTESIML